MNRNVLLFIPAYNCEKQIIRVLDQIDKQVLNYVKEIIVVNNCSLDDTETAAISYFQKHKELPGTVLRNDDNYGLGGSHKIAFQYAVKNGFDFVIVLHGDDQGNIKDLIHYLKIDKTWGYDSFLGSRFERESRLVHYSAFRILGNKVFNFFMTIMLKRKITDLGAGLNMYKTSYLIDEFYKNFPDNLTFNVYMLLYGIHSKSNFKFFPLTWREEDQVSNAKLWKQSLEILNLTLNYCRNHEKLFQDFNTQPESKVYSYKVKYQADLYGED